MFEIDFLPVENEASDSSKSGDAITMQFSVPGWIRPAVVVIDAGFVATGDEVVEHLDTWYSSRRVDLLISTHPDTDHLNGLKAVVQSCDVGELMMHMPWKYGVDMDSFSNGPAIVALYDAAIEKGVIVTEPFTGLTRFEGLLTILGPTVAYYRELLTQYVSEELTGKAAERRSGGSTMLLSRTLTKALDRVLTLFPFETLTDEDDTGPRNKMSVITLVVADGKRMMFTGDAGIQSLDYAAGEYESRVGSFAANPLSVFQVPHHGSKHNVGPTILSRILGPKDAGYATVSAYVSSAKLSEKHPSPKVTNALGRRGARVYATEGRVVHQGSTNRPGWGPINPVAPLQEDDD